MADATKYVPIGGATGNLATDLKNLFSILKGRRTLAFAYAFTLVFVGFTVFLAFSPSPNASSPWFTNIFSSSTVTPTAGSYKSQVSSIFSFFFPNSTSAPNLSRSSNATSETQDSVTVPSTNSTSISDSSSHVANSPANSPPLVNNGVKNYSTSTKSDEGKAANSFENQTSSVQVASPLVQQQNLSYDSSVKNDSVNGVASNNYDAVKNDSPSTKAGEAEATNSLANRTSSVSAASPLVPPQNSSYDSSVKNDSVEGVVTNNYTASLARKQSNGSNRAGEDDELMESLLKCDLFDGEWVKDDSYPLYEPGSCALIDEQFNCVGNGRPDKDYQKYKWKPKGCSLPRLDAHRMLDLLRGKRLVFVGDSLNRNMWESLICILRNAVKDKSKVYEANGRVRFRGEASYCFIFQDYNFSVELFVSPFLVQEWEMPDKNGNKKETLRLDLVGKSSSLYKDADIIIFNTGHWWTHDKTAKGQDYYQEGSHVYHELNVLEAFRRALTTWSRWVDANINPSKSMVFFRGYSASHFSGGQWNSGGQCDSETDPIDNEKYLTQYPPKMIVLENVLKYMKTHVTYLNITRMTDFRKDGHPSIYRKQHPSPEESKLPLKIQDCSHWCLPGVPDFWNEILYAELLMREYRNQLQQKKP